MILLIDGKKAAIKSGSSFEYVSENRAFTDSDAYTLSITLPLAGCPQNLEIFGFLCRMDMKSRNVVLDAVLIDGEFRKSGVVSVVEATETELKVQFLEGRAVQNFNVDYDECYINELNLGLYPIAVPASPSYGTIDDGTNFVPFQWVNDSSNGFLNNEISGLGPYEWADSTTEAGGVSYMPYLLFITKKICDKAGFTYDFSQWEASDDRFLLLCNTIPAAWDAPYIARALPHWSFTEFFAQLERFLVCEFDIDYKEKYVRMTYTKDIDSIAETVKIENVVDEFSSEVSYKDNLSKYKGTSRFGYADRGDDAWKFDSCSRFIEMMEKNPSKMMEIFETLDDYNAWYQSHRGQLNGVLKDASRGDLGRLFHIKETGSYFIWQVVPTDGHWYGSGHGQAAPEFKCRRIDLNRFGDYVYDSEEDDDEKIELKIVPARIDYLSWSRGYAVFLAPSSYSEVEDVDENEIRQPFGYSILKRDDNGESPEYYDKMMVAIWDGNGIATSQPCPIVDERFSLKKIYQSYLNGIKIKSKEKLKLKFISDSIPDVRSIFLIRGRRYLCAKITATFTESGMSQLMKGEFYPIEGDS